MTINVDLARPKAVPAVEVPLVVGVVNPNITGSTWTQYLTLNDVDPPSFTRVCSTTNDSATVAVAAGHGIRVGDVVTGTGIAANTSVTAVDATTITLNNAATATGEDVTLTFNPPEVDARIVGILGEVTVSGTNARVRIRLYRASGLTVAGETDTTAVGDMGAAVGEVSVNVNLDTFLSNLRIPRTNS